MNGQRVKVPCNGRASWIDDDTEIHISGVPRPSSSRRQHWSSRIGEGRQGSAVSSGGPWLRARARGAARLLVACAVAESAERRAGRNGSSQQAKHGPDTEPDFPRHRRLRDTAVPKGCRHDRSEEPGALAGTPGSARGASGNRRPTATVPTGARPGSTMTISVRRSPQRGSLAPRTRQRSSPAARRLHESIHFHPSC